MKTVNLKFNVNKPFGNLFRKRCVLIAVENHEGKILIGSKLNFSPPNVGRLLGGGVDDGESLLEAAVRELREELNLSVNKTDLNELVNFVSKVTDSDGKQYYNETTVFHVNIDKGSYQPGDDVNSITLITKDELGELGERYDQLPETLWYMGKGGCFAWADYAKLYGILHKTVSSELKRKGSR